MAHALIIGGGVAGLGSALTLATRGHRVTVIERDDTPTPSSPTEAFEWDRRGAPQVRHSHALLGRLHNLLRDRHPAVLADLLEAGATELKMSDRMPETLDDRSPMPGDEDLVMIASRRTTLEWVLRTSTMSRGEVDFVVGRGVRHLLTGSPVAGRPRVTGVVLDDGTELHADIVVAANGRRSTVPSWLAELGIDAVEETVEDTGIVYYSRFFQLEDGVEFPATDRLIGGDLTYLKYGVFWGDNGTFSVTLATSDDDSTLRALKDPELFDRTARLLPATANLVDGAATPITQVHSMAGLLNRRRRFDDAEGPLVAGLHVVGDAHICTNPLYGRGCATGFWQADLLGDAVDAEPSDAVAQAQHYLSAVEEHIVPWYDASVSSDRSARKALAKARAEADGESPGDTADADDMMRSVLREGLTPASRQDAVVWRAFMRMVNLLAPPQSLMESDVANRIFSVWQDRDSRPPAAPLGPTRDELLGELELTDAV